MTIDARTAQFRAIYRSLRIEDQHRYYDDRCREYRSAHRQASIARNALLLLAALAGLASQFLDGTARGGAGLVGAVLGAFAVALTAFENLIGFEQVDKLFTDARNSLGIILSEWDDAASDDPEADVDRVEQVFVAENGQWGQLVLTLASEEQHPADP